MQIVHATFKSKEGKEAVELLHDIGVDIEDYKLIESTSGDLLIINLVYGKMDVLIDGLKNRFDFENNKERSLIIFTPDTVIPRNLEKLNKISFRATRESLITFAQNHSEINLQYLMMLLFSGIIVTLGLILDNVAVIVGGMVIAPVLGPILSISLGIILGDIKLVRQGLLAEIVAITFAVGLGIIFGIIIPNVDLNDSLIARTQPSLADILIAMSAGAAGAYVLIKGNLKSGLVGVMVAASLLPVMATIGIGITLKRSAMVWGATLLLLGNYVSLILSTMTIFYIEGLKPQVWFEKRATNIIRKSFLFIISSILILSIPLGYLTYYQFFNESPNDIVYRKVFENFPKDNSYSLENIKIDGNEINLFLYTNKNIANGILDKTKDEINKSLNGNYKINFDMVNTIRITY